MVYPNSPFTNKFNVSTVFNLNNGNTSVDTNEIPCDLNNLLTWICTAPKVSSFRVNTLKYSVDTVKGMIENILNKVSKSQGKIKTIPKVTIHRTLSDVLLVESYSNDEINLNKKEKEVIVDAACGSAILRGAHVFAPGVMAMQSGTKHGDIVSVYADIKKNCKRGLPRIYDCPNKVFVGNGIIRMIRSEIFGDDLKPTGIAVEMTDTLSGLPTISESDLPIGSVLLQNIPSIICGYVLNPQPGEIILDMCAAPGNKSSHLAALMKNQGLLIALDKTPNKVKQLRQRCEEFSLDCIHTFEFDSTKSCDENLKNINDLSVLTKGPPFPCEVFDKILLDAPCSGLGNRPQLLNTITDKVVRSYVPLQRKLFRNAVSLLKPGGHLVYSTCTINLGENEGLVSWALGTFDCLELTLAEPILGGCGWSGTKLTTEQLHLVQRFGPEDGTDSIGFFIARFVKK